MRSSREWTCVLLWTGQNVTLISKTIIAQARDRGFVFGPVRSKVVEEDERSYMEVDLFPRLKSIASSGCWQK